MKHTKKQFSETWKDAPFKHRGIKYILYCPQEMNEFLEIIKIARNFLSPELYKRLVSQQVSIKEIKKDNFAQIFMKEYEEYLFQLGLWKQRQRRSVVRNAARNYVSFYTRNKKFPAKPICIKETKAMFFEDGVFVDMTPEKRNGMMKIAVHGEEGTNILVKYSVPKGMFEYKKYIKDFKAMGGNFFIQNGTMIFVARMEVPFQWKYNPIDTLAFDLNKEDKYFLYFSKSVKINGKTKKIFSQPKESKSIIDELKKINQDIKIASTSKERQKLRYKSQDLHKKLETYYYHICEQIVDYVR